MATTTSQVNGTPKKKLILNAFVESCSGHQSPGLWRHPQDRSAEFNDIYHWVELAKLLESAHFHGIFIADVLVRYLTNIEIFYSETNCMIRVPMMSTKAPEIQIQQLSLEHNCPLMSH